MRIYARVIARSSRNEIKKMGEGDYKIKVTAPPVDGEANEMLIKILAKYFGVAKNAVNIVGGKSAKIKMIDILK
ncbi:MAG: hypothetical protein UR66_C0005G0007 [Candidatus Moranbacteria bacterium GW2011_GWE1_35_17]|nr:MAG: hypothetical protein UR66_C0005G0007 [Candidatus Moranbacteria bacterium GW2011_GWE1_35_17]KKP83863.1 MAG: hypothetical protein UR83_C0032G0008 [Candidatus Moranbacteria bacterium GW2011_GWF2_35_54]